MQSRRLPAAAAMVPAVAVALTGLLALFQALAPPLTLTGDEPRYVAAGFRLYGHAGAGGFAAAGLPPAAGPAVAFGWALPYGGLAAARWLSLAAGAIGLVALGRLLTLWSPVPDRSSIAATAGIAAVTLSLPLLAYVRLVYPETLIFGVTACALLAVATSRPVVAGMLAGALPLAHARALPLAAVLVLIAAFELARAHATPRRAVALGLAFLTVLVASFALQRAIEGNPLGAAFGTFAPSFALLPERLGMQLYDTRHGLLAYAPIYLIGFAGLLAGVIRRDRPSAYAATLLVTYVATFLWASASESWTARYWVGALPMLAIGIAQWFARRPSPAAILAVVPLAAISLANAVMFVLQPAWFLENARASVSDAVLFSATHVHLGLFLPIDADNFGLPAFAAPIPRLLTWTLLVTVAVAIAAVYDAGRIRAYAGAVAACLTAVPFVAGAQRIVPPAAYALGTRSSGASFTLALRAPTAVDAVQLDAELPRTWTTRDAPAHFYVRCTTTSGEHDSIQPSRALILVPNCGNAVRIAVAPYPETGAPAAPRALATVTLLQPLLLPVR